ncbi:hypothetical protein Pyn_11967 [Prunus yedoensis var. nudiflora]|uniref:Uncharacterized protein n=1 Tax=Prunus yedoensis var. nudiflora TaxID=2094558 RepID=A0A314Y638_PRUYE|nr:hypothetical protein Pyn_11967 [Prunus yedoensis var. nudiflora]
MALWMWLEHAAKEYNFVNKLCVTLPNILLNGIADESVMALKCIQQDIFHVDITNRNQDIPLFNALTKTCATLEFFHQNRLDIVRGVTKLFNEVCMRAFDDLFLNHNQTQLNK